MKKTIAAAAFAAIAGSAVAGNSMTLDIGGTNSWGFQGASSNESLSVFLGAGASITSISWDVTLTTVGLSWLDEATIGFEGGLAGGGAEVMPGFGDAFTGSFVNYTGSTGGVALSADGILDIEFYEVGFDDNAGAIDTIYEAGSSITINYIPTPGALAVLGMGGLVAGRRRR